MLTHHGWVHETTEYDLGRLDFTVVALGAALIVGIIIKTIHDNDRRKK